MSLFTSFSISASALTAERMRLDLVADNLANVDTAGKPGGTPAVYQREMPVFAQRLIQETGTDGQPVTLPGGVEITAVVRDNTPPRLKYDPSSPLADKKGYVAYPNINVVNQMVDMMTAVRTYQANVTAFNATKAMFQKALAIGQS